jgi:GNAT superfamily N-acetyltransferase
MATRVTQLESEVHEIKNFDCGNAKLNEFLQTTAGQHQRKFISKTYVLIDDDEPTEIMGFYTLALRRMVSKEELPSQMAKRLPREVPGFSLARLAVRHDLKKQGHGEYLLYHAIDRAARVAAEVGGYAIFVDAKSEEGAGFYRKYGLVPFPDDPLILFMPFANLPK